MYKSLAFKLLIALFIVYAVGCGKKEDNSNNKNKQDSLISALISKDSVSGKQKVALKYVVKKGDKFSYKVVAKTSTSENSPATEGKDVKQDNEIDYFYTKEVDNIEPTGIITFKVNYDSIIISSQMGEQSLKYNSNVNDSMRTNPAFLQYNAVIKEPFYIRVSPVGEITDVYGLEKIHENLI